MSMSDYVTKSGLSVGEVADLRANLAAAEAERDALRVEVGRLREAAAPFAKWAAHKLRRDLPADILEDPHTPVLGDEWRRSPEICVGDLQRIAAFVPDPDKLARSGGLPDDVRGENAREDGWLVSRGAIPAYATADAKPSPDAPTLAILYRNHRGDIGIRRIRPLSVRFGATEWHTEPQWLLRAYDAGKDAEREFAMQDIAAVIPPELRQDVFDAIIGIYGEPKPSPEAREALEIARHTLQEIADGAWGDNLMVRGQAAAALARMGGGNGG